MGSFELTPQEGETYAASVILSNGHEKRYPLPATSTSGYVLNVIDMPGRDSLVVCVQATPAIIGEQKKLLLIGVNVGAVCYASTLKFSKTTTSITGKINKNKFNTGLVHFALFNENGDILAERNAFIDRRNRLNINITEQAVSGDSMKIAIAVTDKDKHPIKGSFSMAITDATQVSAANSTSSDMYSSLLMQAGLNNYNGNAASYFDGDNVASARALDDLVLNYGSFTFDWKKMMAASANGPAYRVEGIRDITGRALRINKPQAGVRISLLAIKGGIIMRDTLTDKQGRFMFSNLPYRDSIAYLLQVNEKRGSVFRTLINVDEFKPARFNIDPTKRLMPAFVNSDSTLINFARKNAVKNRELGNLRFAHYGKLLKEVVVKSRKIVTASRFYAGGAEPDVVLDENDLLKEDNATVEDILKRHIKGFVLRPYPCTGMPVRLDYMVFCDLMSLVIDGTRVDEFYVIPANPSFTDHSAYLQSFLAAMKAEDVRGIEVKNGYVELTTWSGNGAFMRPISGRYLYRPVTLSWPKVPIPAKLPAGSPLADTPPTILWDPDILTDTNGTASRTVYFKKGKNHYNIVVQGADLNGLAGTASVDIY
jgi:hypothetical protein